MTHDIRGKLENVLAGDLLQSVQGNKPRYIINLTSVYSLGLGAVSTLLKRVYDSD